MPMRRAKAFVPVALVFLLRLTGFALGLRGRGSSANSRPAPRAAFDADAHLAGIRRPGPSRFRQWAVFLGLTVVLLIGVGIYTGYQVKFTQQARARAVALTAGDPDFGRNLAMRYGCAGCHTIPGVPGAQGKVGPSLQGFAARVYIGGVATNSPDTLVQWIENPRAIDPKTAMPVTGISRAEARHVAAYLYTLR
jgi:cytochrome c2